MANLINLEKVSKASASGRCSARSRSASTSVERIGIVGRNGDGKTTLLEVITGLEEPDAGRVSMYRGVEIGYLHQGDELVDTHSVRDAVLGGRADHEWLADSTHARGRRPSCWRGSRSTAPSSGCRAASAAGARWPPCCSVSTS